MKPKTKPIRARKMWADGMPEDGQITLFAYNFTGLIPVIVLPDDAASRKARVEAVAKAIYEGWRKWTQVCDVPAPWSKSVSPYKESAYRHARAALAAERGR